MHREQHSCCALCMRKSLKLWPSCRASEFISVDIDLRDASFVTSVASLIMVEESPAAWSTDVAPLPPKSALSWRLALPNVPGLLPPPLPLLVAGKPFDWAICFAMDIEEAPISVLASFLAPKRSLR